MKRLVILAPLALAACAGPLPKPIVDLKTVNDPAAYQKDLIECVTLADYYFQNEASVMSSAASGAALGGAGATAGAMISKPISGSPGLDIGTGAVVGMVGGAYSEARDQERDRNAGAGRCLENRGYTIINAKEVWLDPEMWCRWSLLRTGHMTWKWDQEKLDACKASEEQRRANLALRP